MLSIQLHNIILHAYHGLYAEEKVLGNDFELNITVSYVPKKLPVQHISDTIDYVAVYELAKKRMALPTPLLETVVTEMGEEILAQFSLAEEVSISIRKIHPPIPQMQGSVGVSVTLKRKAC